jgi:hypothetical protein
MISLIDEIDLVDVSFPQLLPSKTCSFQMPTVSNWNLYWFVPSWLDVAAQALVFYVPLPLEFPESGYLLAWRKPARDFSITTCAQFQN